MSNDQSHTTLPRLALPSAPTITPSQNAIRIDPAERRSSRLLAEPHQHVLGPNLIGFAFPNMKLNAIRRVIDEAARRGELRPGGHIVESSSGTAGQALALLAAERGYQLTLVTPPLPDAFRAQLESLGQCKVIEVDEHDEPQQARLMQLSEVRSSDPGCFWPRQYENPDVLDGYAGIGEQLAAKNIDVVVAAVGSGGSSCGIISALRRFDPEAILIGVDAFGSVLFGQDNRRRDIAGMGNSLMPALLDHSAFDEVHWLSGDVARLRARRLKINKGISVGPTGGATYHVAAHVAATNPMLRVACIMADNGERYTDPADGCDGIVWASDSVVCCRTPYLVSHPRQAKEPWSSLLWGRRRLSEVAGACPNHPLS